MQHIGILKNTIQEYAWGSFTAIAELTGKPAPSSRPQAELWMGAHPKAPSFVEIKQQWRRLPDVIAANPEAVLGPEVARRHGGRLPFLFKVLAAARPLSLQAHPDLIQARQGFDRENRLGIPLNAADRNYRDNSHKPECICALTAFWALSGFRNAADILDLMTGICPKGLERILPKLRQEPGARGLKDFFEALVTLEIEPRKQLLQETLENARSQRSDNPVYRWILRLAEDYPNDIGILSPAFLNLICLQPGQAMFLPTREMHAYLEGVAIELMANSDNVLRGGLTAKHVDVVELLKVLNFKPRQVHILSPEPLQKCEKVYSSGADEFLLSVISLEKGQKYENRGKRSVEIIICTDGRALLTEFPGADTTVLNRGDSAIVPAALQGYDITGDALLYKAAVPLTQTRLKKSES